MRPIIKVENLGKQYRIGARQEPYLTIRDSIAKTFRAPLARFRRNDEPENTIWALKDVNFEVAPGEVVGVIGGNGAGKSTLLKVLSRITDPTTGQVDIYGRVGSLLEVGTGFHAELSGRENIYLNGAILGMKRGEIDRKFDEIVAFAEIEKFIDAPVKHYSTGMYMRLAFSVAAHLEPEILIVDEVLSVGDIKFQKKCLGRMGDIAKEGRTVIFVSHDLETIRKLCGVTALIEKGMISAMGNTIDVVEKYLEANCETRPDYSIPVDNGNSYPGYAYRLTVENVKGEPISSIPVGEGWQVRVSFRLNRKVEHFIIALGLLTQLDTPLRTSWSAPRTLGPGDYEAVFRENDLLIATGRYYIVIGMSSFETTFFYTERAGVLEISRYSKGIDAVRIADCGLLLNPMAIDIREADSGNDCIG
jgi:lipopolysaccharide transport system ATP-binding protein